MKLTKKTKKTKKTKVAKNRPSKELLKSLGLTRKQFYAQCPSTQALMLDRPQCNYHPQVYPYKHTQTNPPQVLPSYRPLFNHKPITPSLSSERRQRAIAAWSKPPLQVAQHFSAFNKAYPWYYRIFVFFNKVVRWFA